MERPVFHDHSAIMTNDPRDSTRPEEEESQADKSTSKVSSDNIKHQYDLTPKNRNQLQTL